MSRRAVPAGSGGIRPNAGEITLRFRLESAIATALLLCSLVALLIYEIVHRSGFSYASGPHAIYSVDSFDEGVYSETGILIAHGYQLYRQIYSAQPPLLPAALSMVDRLFGSGLVEARWTILGFGILTVLGVFVAAGQVRGWLAGGVAAALLVLSPEFLVYSHAVEEEIPMTALTIVALVLAIAWFRRREPELAAAAGLFFGLALLTKFLAVSLLAPLAIIVALAVWERRAQWLAVLRDALLFVVATAAPILLSLVVWGHAEWTQMVGDRLGATADQAQFQHGSSLHLLRDFLSTDPGLAALAGAGAIALLIWNWKMGLVLDSWLLATLAVLMKYHPLFGHHLIVLLAPMALVAGAGVSCLVPSRSTTRPEHGASAYTEPATTPTRRSLAQGRWSMAALAIAGIGLIVYIGLLPRLAGSYSSLLVPTSPADRQLSSVAGTVSSYTPRNGFAAAADPIICVLANRLCVPQMVDTSYVRVETGKLSGAIRDSTRYRAEVIVLGRAICLYPYMRRYDHWVHVGYRIVRRVNIGSGSRGQCPWQPSGKPVHPHWPAGVYVLGARSPSP